LRDQRGTGSLQPSGRAFSLKKRTGFEHEQPAKGFILKAEVNAKTPRGKAARDREMARKRPGV
jgi:hypothetical protein